MQNWIIRIILVILPLGWPGFSFANIAFYHYGVEKGLPETHIVSISQDSTGFIWLAGDNSMFRFDGIQFKAYQNSFSNTQTHSFNRINALFTDSRGTLWVGDNNGVSTYDFVHDRFVKTDEDWSRFRVTDFDEDEDGNIWIATNHGLIGYHPETEQYQWFTGTGNSNSSRQAILPDTQIHKITCQPEGKIWFTSYEAGLFQLDTKSGTVKNYTTIGESDFGILSVSNLGFSANQLFIGTNSGGLFIFNPEDETIINETFDNFGLMVRHFHLSDDSLIWVATTNGLIRFNYSEGGYSRYINDPANVLSMNRTTADYVFSDKDKNIWVSSGIRGVNYGITNNPFKQFIINEVYPYSLFHKEVTAIHFDEQGNMWLGYEAGLMEQHTFDPLGRNSFQLTSKSQSGAPGSIMAIFEDSKNRVWVGGWDCGLQRVTPNGKSVEYAPVQPEELAREIAVADIRGFAEDNRGNLWIVFHGIGLGRYNPDSHQLKMFRPNPDSPLTTLSNEYPFDICLDNSNNLWVATAHGITKLSLPGEHITTYFAEDGNPLSLSSNTVYTIYCDAAGTVWAGTSNGLNVYNPALDAFQPVLTDHEISFLSVSGIQSLNPGEIWISTLSGIIKVNYPVNFPHETLNIQTRFFDRSKGLLSTSYFQRSSAVSNDGMVYFGGNEGIDFFNPDDVATMEERIPEALITELYVDGKPVYPYRHIKGKDPVILNLDYSHQMISIRYTAFNFSVPGELLFRYKMEGLNEDWIYPEVSQRATFSNLKPGTYRFLAEARFGNNSWSDPPAEVIIDVKPAFWTTVPFILISSLLVVGLVWFIFWYRSRLMHVRQVKLEQIIDERTTQLQQKNEELEIANATKNKFFSIISHDLRSPFSGLLGILELVTDQENDFSPEKKAELLETAKESAENIFELLNNLLTWARSQTSETVCMPANQNLSQMLKKNIELKNATATHKNITIEQKFPDEMEAYFDGDMINTVIRNVLNNAIKFTKPDGRISISAGYEDGMAVVHIADTGIGLTEESKRDLFDVGKNGQKGTLGEKGTGLGLVISKEFVKKNNGKIWATDNEPQGTVFHFSVPAQKNE